jgi:hypothetical protein
MANTGFDAGNLRLVPTETGVEARAGTARRIGMFSNQLGSAEDTLARDTERLAGETEQLGRQTEQLGSEKGAALTNTGRVIGSSIDAAGEVAVKYAEHQEISHGAATFAKLQDSLTQQWNDQAKSADPNDRSVAANFQETVVKPALDNYQSAFNTEGGQRFAQAKVDSLQQHMTEKASADMSTLAGIAVKKNVSDTATAMSNTAFNDPSALPNLLANADHSISALVASSPNMSAVDAARVQAEVATSTKAAIVKSAAIGYIEKTGAVPPWANDPKYASYINGPELKMFENAARSQQKVNALTDKQAQLAQRQLADQQVHASAAKTITDNVRVDPQTNQTTINPKFFKDALEIARKNPDAPNAAETVRTMLSWGEAQQNKERKVVTDPAAASAIDTNMFASDNPTSNMDILKAEAAGKLTRADAEIRIKIIDQRDKMPADPQFKLAMDGAKELIEGRSAGEKSLQAGKYASFMQQFLGDYQRQKNAGTLPANALSLRDPNSMISKMIEPNKSPLAASISGNGGVGPAPRNDVMPAIPAANQRPAGSVYQTPRGPMKWTGTGWVAP